MPRPLTIPAIPTRQGCRTKIVATLGPASDSPHKVTALIRTGVDTFRLNFSHGSHADHRRRILLVRSAARQTGKDIAVLQDIQGPKVRVGDIPRRSARPQSRLRSRHFIKARCRRGQYDINLLWRPLSRSQGRNARHDERRPSQFSGPSRFARSHRPAYATQRRSRVPQRNQFC